MRFCRSRLGRETYDGSGRQVVNSSQELTEDGTISSNDKHGRKKRTHQHATPETKPVPTACSCSCSCMRRESQPLAQCWPPRQTFEAGPLVLWGHYVVDGTCLVGRPAVTIGSAPVDPSSLVTAGFWPASSQTSFPKIVRTAKLNAVPCSYLVQWKCSWGQPSSEYDMVDDYDEPMSECEYCSGCQDEDCPYGNSEYQGFYYIDREYCSRCEDKTIHTRVLPPGILSPHTGSPRLHSDCNIRSHSLFRHRS